MYIYTHIYIYIHIYIHIYIGDGGSGFRVRIPGGAQEPVLRVPVQLRHWSGVAFERACVEDAPSGHVEDVDEVVGVACGRKLPVRGEPGSEEGSYLRRIDLCITQLLA